MLVARRTADTAPGRAGAEAIGDAMTGRGAGATPVAVQRHVRRAVLVNPAIAAVMLLLTLGLGQYYGIGLRDPDGVIGSRLGLLLILLAIFWALDVVPRAILQVGWRPAVLVPRARALAKQRWGWRRIAIVLGSIIAFYITYLCYRNMKSYVPLMRPELLDNDLRTLEISAFGGDPSAFLHSVLGTGVSAHFLSAVYLVFLTFVPISIGFALVWSNNMQKGLWWVTALSLNWVFGALSYFVIPTVGPAFAAPQEFTRLPETGVTALQEALLSTREVFLASPVGSGELQSIAAFASLHVAIVFTGALMAWMLGAPRPVRIIMWTYLALTSLATIYFGWHYILDDLAGFGIGAAAVYISARLTGWRIERPAPPVAGAPVT